MEKIKVETYEIVAKADGDYSLRCQMSDGSVWQCNLEGDFWKKIYMGYEELSEKFNNRVI